MYGSKTETHLIVEMARVSNHILHFRVDPWKFLPEFSMIYIPTGRENDNTSRHNNAATAFTTNAAYIQYTNTRIGAFRVLCL